MAQVQEIIVSESGTAEFGQFLLAWRQARNLDQCDAAKTIGISSGAWSYYERGERFPTLEKASKMAKRLGVEIRII